MAIDQASGRFRGRRASICPATLLAGLQRSLLASLVLAAATLTWRCLSGALAISPAAGWLMVVTLWGVIGGGGWWVFMLFKVPAAARAARLQTPRAGPVHAAIDPSVVQQLRRDRRPDGQEQVTGWMRVDLAAGQRVAQVHVAFCPPLERTPAIELRQVAGPLARLKLGQALAYGARFELKLAAPGPASITLEYTATTAGAACEPTIAAETAAKRAALPAAG